ncbi:hypothetical protein IEN85_06600 [Pelagicoccus sp. NFK12]|uniref:Uncharacterized protein n=1 Tax=Pelagicoccus enzymogenes TaxID=2773457 RepID=A0A927IEK9_9BACT|nr:hypothetical protein [Pelagicoccus enzymogenes]MBD5779157.1 hypothetical protein [Pelagicoccus enzymogenes]
MDGYKQTIGSTGKVLKQAEQSLQATSASARCLTYIGVLRKEVKNHLIAISTILTLTLVPHVDASKRIAFSLIEQQGEETIFLMVTEQIDDYYMHVGIGHGEPPIKLTEEEFSLLRYKLLGMDISAYESNIPPDFEKNYAIILRNDYGGEGDSGTTYSVPKDETPKKIKEWISLMKKISGIQKTNRSN